MTTPVEKQNHAKFCEFHGEVGHTTDECMHLKKQIKEMLKAGKLSHLIKELKQNSGKEQPKATKKGETSGKDKALAILMVQPWERVARQKITQSFSPDPEILFPPLGTDEGTEGPMIIEAEIGGHCIHRMYVDGGSASEILFSGEIIWPIGQIQLLATIGDEDHPASAWMNFVVVISPSPYNGIIGRPGVKKLQADPSTAHRMLKIPVEGGVITLKSSRLVPLECAMVSGPEGTSSATKPTIEERVKVAINLEYPEQTVMIGSTLTEDGRNKLCGLLMRNLDIFAWKPADMTGVPRHIAEHRLNVREGCSPVRQKKRGQAADRNQAIQEEVGKLVKEGIMKEVHYHDWLSNPVMVKKHDDSWRMCVDFKDLNKACPKDGYPLPEIDWKVESLCGFPFKCFLDAYKGYHQIQMAKEDEEKTAFITSQGIFCYTKMPFGLRNAGATYQRLVDKAFHKQIGRNLELYMDDLVIKSRTEDEIVKDIKETFKTLREINMKLNPKKCTFEVEEGMFLGYKVNTKGLKVCPDKVDAVLSLPSPKCLKDVQKLNGKLASLNRFLAKSAEKSLPFFKTLKKCDFLWTTEAEEAFKQMKQLIAELPMLTAPIEKEEHIVYLAATKEMVIAVLMTEREAKQMPIYFVSRALRGPELNYTSMEKLVLALVHASKHLKRFDATNNEVEYEALIAGLRIAEQIGVKIRALTNSFKAFSIRQVPRSENKKADTLSKIASTSFAHLSKQVLVEELKEKSISKVEILAVVEEEENTWMTPIFEYLMDETLPADVKEARAVMHAGTRSIVAKALRIGYYWPTMHKDARALIRACGDCQVHKPVLRNPQQKLTLIMSPWPFYKWEIDIAGPFPEGPGKVKFLIVAIDYFTKWIEAKPVATITGNQIKKFMWENIVCRANRSLGEGIKARLEARSKNWMEELPHVLWAHRIMIKSSNGDTPFSLTREEASIREAKSKAKMKKYYNSKVRSTSFKLGDLVYRNNDASRAEDTGKLGPKWEGLYEVTEALGKGAYKLKDRDGKQLPRTWNISNLKKCYIHKM
ncbi:reverse transcriptase domain-containing protein [Tanacetum coccineum]